MNNQLSLSIIIPSLNSERTISSCINSLKIWRNDYEIILVDAMSNDKTIKIAKELGSNIITTEPGRGHQLSYGANSAKNKWLLFIHSDTILEDKWINEVEDFILDSKNHHKAAAFRFSLDTQTREAKFIEKFVSWRSNKLKLAFGDQGLLIHRNLYIEIGGFKSMKIMEDLDIIIRIGKSRLKIFDSKAITSSIRYQNDGWIIRPLKNFLCLTMFFAGMPDKLIAWIYK